MISCVIVKQMVQDQEVFQGLALTRSYVGYGYGPQLFLRGFQFDHRFSGNRGFKTQRFDSSSAVKKKCSQFALLGKDFF